MILVRNIVLPLSCSQQDAIKEALKRLRVPKGQQPQAEIAKVSVDARKGTPKLVYAVAVHLADPAAEQACAARCADAAYTAPTDFTFPMGEGVLPHRPVVCGLGPGGLFAALLLARSGLRPIVLERGPSLQKRVQAVEAFAAGGAFDPNANIQFGEGGAGTFSDGKLTTRIGDALCGYVTQTFLQHGAPAEIAYLQKPHIGTDLLRGVITGIRHEIQQLGGTVLFETPLTGLSVRQGKLVGVQTANGAIPCDALVFAPGHSARDTFAALMEMGIQLQCKPFSVGVRAEHRQTTIDQGLYHEAAGHPALPKGEYQLSRHFGQRCVYTFCMCPGGSVVAAASEEGGVVTNGMSLHARSGPNANAAVVVSVGPDDFDHDPQKAIAFQHGLEQKAFAAAGGGYAAPAETLDSFLNGAGKLNLDGVQPTYSRGVRPVSIGSLLPDELAGVMRQGFLAFDRMLPGYARPDTVLTGLETRTSGPVRLPRGQDMQSQQIQGLYPCGEGAGYAGGIMSAAVDGLRCARAILAQYGRCAE